MNKLHFFYRKADSIKGNTNKIYSFTNWLELENILVLFGKRSWGQTADKTNSYTLPVLDDVKKDLTKRMSSIEASPDEMNYWDMVAIANIKLCLLLLDNNSPKDAKAWNALTDNFLTVWQKAGSQAKTKAEMEHFEFLVDALSAKQIKKTISSAVPESADKKEKQNVGIYIEELRKAFESFNSASSQSSKARKASSTAAARKRKKTTV